MTGGNTDHHTTADLQHIDVRTISSSISCVDFLSTPLVKGSCFQCLARFGPPRTAGCMGDDASNLKLSCFGYGMAGMASMSAIEKEKQRLHRCISQESTRVTSMATMYSTTRPLMLSIFGEGIRYEPAGYGGGVQPIRRSNGFPIIKVSSLMGFPLIRHCL